jgi:type IV secretion system protein VirB5
MVKIRFSMLALSAALTFGTIAQQAQATGILTADVASLAQLVLNAQEQANQAGDALSEATRGIEQAKSQFNEYKGLTTGNDQLGNFLDNPALNRVLPLEGWAKVYDSASDLAELRERYGMTSDNVTTQQKFDRVLSVMSALEKVYAASNERLENANALRNRLNSVQTPQEKEDLELRYQHEHLELQVQQQRLGQMQMLVQQEEKLQNQGRIQSFKDYAKGKSSTIPQY